MRSEQHLRCWIFTSLLYLLLLSFHCKAEIAVDPVNDSPKENSGNSPEIVLDDTPVVDPGKAYDGKGAKVLPILAKLCEKYETMNDEDKAKLLEKADIYRAKFQSVIDKIDDATALKYNLNRELINKILGLNQYGKVEVEEATVEEVPEYEPVPEPEPTEPVPEPEPTEPVPIPEPVPLPEPVYISHPPEDYDSRSEDNYDHLIIDHSQEPVIPDTYNIDNLKEKHAYTDDQQYQKKLKASMQYIQRTLSVDPNPGYPQKRPDPRPMYPQMRPDPRPYYPSFGIDPRYNYQQNAHLTNRIREETYKNLHRQIPYPPQQFPEIFRMHRGQAYDMDASNDDLEAYAPFQARPYGYNIPDLMRVMDPLPSNYPYGSGAGQLPVQLHPDYEAMVQEYLHQLNLQERLQQDMLRYYNP